jgi:hypothetical protein
MQSSPVVIIVSLRESGPSESSSRRSKARAIRTARFREVELDRAFGDLARDLAETTDSTADRLR